MRKKLQFILAVPLLIAAAIFIIWRFTPERSNSGGGRVARAPAATPQPLSIPAVESWLALAQREAPGIDSVSQCATALPAELPQRYIQGLLHSVLCDMCQYQRAQAIVEGAPSDEQAGLLSEQGLSLARQGFYDAARDVVDKLPPERREQYLMDMSRELARRHDFDKALDFALLAQDPIEHEAAVRNACVEAGRWGEVEAASKALAHLNQRRNRKAGEEALYFARLAQQPGGRIVTGASAPMPPEAAEYRMDAFCRAKRYDLVDQALAASARPSADRFCEAAAWCAKQGSADKAIDYLKRGRPLVQPYNRDSTAVVCAELGQLQMAREILANVPAPTGLAAEDASRAPRLLVLLGDMDKLKAWAATKANQPKLAILIEELVAAGLDQQAKDLISRQSLSTRRHELYLFAAKGAMRRASANASR